MENSVSNYMFPASNDISYLKQQTCILHFKYISGVISIKITYFIFKWTPGICLIQVLYYQNMN